MFNELNIPTTCADDETNVVPLATNVPFTTVLEPNVINVPVSVILESLRCSLPLPFGNVLFVK